MRDITIRNIPWRLYRSYVKEARKHKRGLEDELRDRIFEFVMERYPTERALLIGRLSPSARLRFLRRQRGYAHLID